MNTGLIEQRYPILGAVLSAWQEDRAGELPEALAPYIVRLWSDQGDWRISASGAVVDVLYGSLLTGSASTVLTPGREGLTSEAEIAHESGRPLLLEDEISLPGGARRVARLYLPLPGADSAKKSVLCGIVACD
jgi:hypothetical protein